MPNGLTINEDVLEMLLDLDGKELKNLVSCLFAMKSGSKMPTMQKAVKFAYNRILADNTEEITDLSEKRRQAAYKRWRKGENIQTDAKVYANDANHANDAIAFLHESKEEERSKEEENTLNNINTVYKPPSLEEIKNYAESKGYIGFNAESFWYFYDSKNWMVGKTKMKNWKSAVSGWYSRDQARQEKPKPAYVPKDDRQTDYTGITRDLFLRDLNGG